MKLSTIHELRRVRPDIAAEILEVATRGHLEPHDFDVNGSPMFSAETLIQEAEKEQQAGTHIGRLISALDNSSNEEGHS